MSLKDRWVLPEGIEEILPAEARRLEILRRRLLDLFVSWGYELVMPPLIEYLESLLTGSGGDLALQTFTITDQLTGRLMGIRPDMTPQAARIDAHYLRRSGPVRLCYLGPVLHTRPEELGGSREPLQLGAELFGHSGPESDAEILALMTEALAAAGVRQPHIELGHVGVFRALAGAADMDAGAERELFDALQRKARTEVEALLGAGVGDGGPRRRLLELLDFAGGPEVLALARTRLRGAPPEVGHALDHLEAVAERAARLGAPPLAFDLAELSGYHYYTGVVFSAFVAGHGRAVAKGGRYDGIGKAFGRERAATGFGADLRHLARLTEGGAPAARGILAPGTDEPDLLREVARLRAGGERVVARLPGAAGETRDYGCDRELYQKNGRWVVQAIDVQKPAVGRG